MVEVVSHVKVKSLFSPPILLVGLACFLAENIGKGAEPNLDHWAFRPVSDSPPPKVEGVRHPVDAFVQTRLASANLSPAPAASRAVLIRRLFHDLTGLPPSYERFQAFEHDERPDTYERLTDELLASPRFGERWGRHWLDVARYADSKGYLAGGESRSYPFAYVYRDWVIRAFNENLPFDEFVRKQLAADFIVDSPNHPDLAALGFLTVGPRFLNRRNLILDDRIDVVTRGLMGFTVACARCHDHFYDPIPQEDYYSLYGVFDLSRQPKEPPLVGKPEESSPQYQAFRKKLGELEAELNKHLQEKRNYLRSEEGLRVYLQAAHDGRDLPDDRLEALAGKRKLYPRLTHRWRTFLRTKAKQNDNLFAAWRAFAKAKPGEFPRIASALSRTSGKPPLAFLLKKLKDDQSPKDFSEVVGWYAAAFAEALVAAEAGHRKGLALLVSASGFPANVDLGGAERYFDTAARNRTNALRAKVSKHQAEHPGSPPRAMTLEDLPNTYEPRVFLRGNVHARGHEVPRRFLAALSPGNPDERSPYVKGSGRLELAESILAPENPLTARVFVNRVWTHLFDRGLVRTPSDFGLRGEAPTHPALLDHLAARFVADDWDVKSLVRYVVTSEAYRRASGPVPDTDPENRLLAVMNRKRLDFEAMRDGLLAASGELDLSMGGPSVRLTEKPHALRRAVYGQVERQNLPALFRTFDFANPNIHAPSRPETTVPQQALFALNDPFVLARAEKLADLTSADTPQGSCDAQVRFLHRRIFARDPTPATLAATREFLGKMPTRPQLVDLAQSFLVSNGFFFVD